MSAKCKTPGAVFKIAVRPRSVAVVVELPRGLELELDERAAKLLEGRLHGAVEAALAPFYPEGVDVG